MTKKTKFEKAEGKDTSAKFSTDEVYGLIHGSYAADRKKAYLAKISERPLNPRLDEFGAEVLSPHSMVADVDMQPLSTRQNLARFQGNRSTPLENGDGYDADDQDDADESFYISEGIDNMPTPHELRAKRLDQKLTKARNDAQAEMEARRKAGETPAPASTTETAQAAPAATAAQKTPSE